MEPRLLVLDDYEGRIAGAPAMARLRELAEVTVLERPLRDGDLAGVRVLLAIRERTRLDARYDAALKQLTESVRDGRCGVVREEITGSILSQLGWAVVAPGFTGATTVRGVVSPPNPDGPWRVRRWPGPGGRRAPRPRPR